MSGELFRKLGVTPHRVGIAMGWLTSAICITKHAEHYQGVESLVAVGLFSWGTLSMLITAQQRRRITDIHTRELRAHGVDPDKLLY